MRYAFLSPGVPLDAGCADVKRRGDRVMIGRNRGPLYQIVHIRGEVAWIESVDGRGEQLLVPVANLRRTNAGIARIAA